ncbi:MAG: OmpA family protein [Acidobacteriota bacterium]
MRVRGRKLLFAFSVMMLLYGGLARVLAQNSSDVTFDTVAITYPQGKKVKISLIGTERFAKNIKGEALIERRKSVTLVHIDIGRLPPPSQLGPAFTTYVIWAITPEGQVDNLGEYRQRNNETLDNWFGSEIDTATPHQTFSLIITAEPYYLVSSPSRLVVVANQNAPNITSAANQISFAGDADFERVLVTPDAAAERKDSHYPIELLQARRALDIARYYESENYAPNLYDNARTAYELGERHYQENKRDDAKESAQLAIRLADRARSLSVSRKKARQLRELMSEKEETITRLEDEARTNVQATTEMQTRLEDEARRRRAVEQENERLLKDLDLVRREIGVEKNALEMEKTLFNKLQDENLQLREQLEKLQRLVSVAERDRQMRELRDEVARKFETRRDNRGIVLIIPDSFFDGEQSTNISASGSFNLEPIINLLKQTNNNIIIESFTDNRGSQQARFKFTQDRAQALLKHFTARGIAPERIQSFANGGSNPRAENRTSEGRTANRRIELLLTEGSNSGTN